MSNPENAEGEAGIQLDTMHRHIHSQTEATGMVVRGGRKPENQEVTHEGSKPS